MMARFAGHAETASTDALMGSARATGARLQAAVGQPTLHMPSPLCPRLADQPCLPR